MDLMTALAGTVLERAYEPTENDLRRIKRVAGTRIPAERLFIVPYRISSSDVDSHYTWFGRMSLDNFVAAGRSEQGVSVLRGHDHRSGAVGRVFDSALTELERATALRKQEIAAKLAADPEREALAVDRKAYITRDGFMPDGEPNEKLIQRIEDGIERATSVGAGLGPGSTMTCDICGGDYRSYESCKHFLGATYEDEDRGVLVMTACIDGARSAEDSFVFAGSNPAAEVMRQFNASKALRLHQDGLLDVKEIRAFEARHRLHVLQPPTISIPESVGPLAPRETDRSKEAPMSTKPEAPENTGADASETVTDVLGTDRAKKAALWDRHDPVRGALLMLEEEIDKLERKVNDANVGHAAQVESIREALGIADGEETMAGIARVNGLAAIGRVARDGLFEEYAKSVVRVEGDNAPDEDELRRLTAGWSVEQLDAATKRNQKLAEQIFEPGTQLPRRVDGEDENDTSGRKVLTGAAARAY